MVTASLGIEVRVTPETVTVRLPAVPAVVPVNVTVYVPGVPETVTAPKMIPNSMPNTTARGVNSGIVRASGT